ncbi:MAG: DMT family transporter [Clostridia bacterium]|nr:DMT family transporter [Clostridia bacterium]
MNLNALSERQKGLLGAAMLLFATTIWGSTFVAQSVGMDHIGPFTYNTLRSLIAAVAILTVSLLLDAVKRKRGTYRQPTSADLRLLLIGGACCGLAYFCASTLQQFGMQYTTVGKAGFLTALYIIEVPIVGIFMKKRVRPLLWGCVVIAIAGMYLLCMNGAFTLALGDLLVFLCSFAFTGHILTIDRFAGRVDPVKLSALQFLTAGLLSFPPMLFFETWDTASVLAASGSILYAALLSSGVAYTLQIIGQKLLQPTHASLVMSLESVFSLLSGVIVLHEMPTVREGIGCALMFLAIILAQLPERKPRVES